MNSLPGEGDVVVAKRRYSGFLQTELPLTLRERGVGRLELAGVCTNVCVLYTAAEAVMWGFQLAVDPRLVTSFDPEAHEFALRQMKEVLGVELLE